MDFGNIIAPDPVSYVVAGVRYRESYIFTDRRLQVTRWSFQWRVGLLFGRKHIVDLHWSRGRILTACASHINATFIPSTSDLDGKLAADLIIPLSNLSPTAPNLFTKRMILERPQMSPYRMIPRKPSWRFLHPETPPKNFGIQVS